LTAGILLVHLSPNDLAPETHDFVARLNHQTEAYFIAQHGWILAFGNIKALLRSDTLAGWTARRAAKAFPVLYLDGTPLLRQLNRYLKSQVRRQQKNRPWRRYGYQRLPYCGLVSPRPSDSESLAAITKRVASLLHYAVELVPIVERDREEIYPADFSTARIPLPQRTNWRADKLERWRRQGMLLCGISSRAALGLDGLHLRNYSEPARLLTKFGRCELVSRQKGGHVCDVLAVTSPFVDLPAIERRLALYLWERLTPPETQQVLKRIGRLYKNSCWWSKKGPRRLFDKAWSSSGMAQSWNRAQARVRLDPADAAEIAKQEVRQVRREGGRVIYLGNPAKRHASLAMTRAAYNEQYQSYLNSRGLGKTLRLRGSLNIPRDAHIENIKNDFVYPSVDKEKVA
jgi:hypothetical protein